MYSICSCSGKLDIQSMTVRVSMSKWGTVAGTEMRQQRSIRSIYIQHVGFNYCKISNCKTKNKNNLYVLICNIRTSWPNAEIMSFIIMPDRHFLNKTLSEFLRHVEIYLVSQQFSYRMCLRLIIPPEKKFVAIG
jgi:hypothetical protein